MATRTVANGGGNYNATATWVEGIVPTLSDDVVFTATSGNLTINAASLNCLSINFTNYVGTITFTQPLNVYGGGINLGTGGYTQAGGSGIIVRAAATLTSNGVVFSRGLAFSTGATVTLADNWTVTGVLQLGGTTNQVINGNNLYVTSLNTNNTGACSGTTNFIFNSTGTWDNSSTGQLRNNVTINTTGTITISGNVYYNTGTLTYTAGTVVTTGSTLNIGGSATLSTGTLAWNNLTITAAATVTLGANLVVTNTFTVNSSITATITPGAFAVDFSTANVNIGIASGTGNNFTYNGTITCVNFQAVAGNTYTNTLNGTTFNITGNFTLTTFGGGGSLTGTSSFNFTGTGTIQQTNWSLYLVPILNNIIINTAGTITFASGTTLYYQTGTITYTAGTVVTTGFSLRLTSNATLNSNGITWNIISVLSSATITLSSNLTASGLVTLGSAGAVTVNINGAGINLICGNGLTSATTTGLIGGTANIRVTGGTITSAGSLNGGYIQVANFEIAGNVTFASTGTFYFYGGSSATGTFTYTSGTVTTTGSTAWFQMCNLNSNGITWNNVWILSGVATALTLTSNMLVNGLLTLGYTTVNVIINNNGSTKTITAAGGITLSGSSSVVSGTANIIVTGGTITGTSAVQLRNNLEIVGNVTFASGVAFYYNTGTLLYTSGTVTTTNSTLVLSASTTLNTNGITWVNITINATSTITLSSNITWSGTLSITSGNITFSGVGTVSGAVLSITNNGTTILNSDVTCTGLVSIGANGITSTVNNNGTSKTITATNGFTINGTTSVVTGTANFKVTGGTITGSGNPNTGGYIAANFEIAGNTVFSGSLYHYGGASGTNTFTYTSGTVTTTGSTLILNSSVATPGTVAWNNVQIVMGAAVPLTLKSDMTVNGLLTLGWTTINNIINNDGTARTITAAGGITFASNVSTSVVSGTAGIKATGGTITGVSTAQLRNNLEIAGNVTFANGVTFYYNTGTITYTSGTVTTTGSTLNCGATTSFNTGGMNWNNVTLAGTATFTLLSNLNLLGALTINQSSGTLVINGLFNLTVGGNLTLTGTTAVTGTTPIVLNGTGTWTTSTGALRNNLTINSPSGTITISGNVYYDTGTLTYVAGTISHVSNSQLVVGNFGSTTTFNTGGMTWNNFYTSSSITIALLSNLNISGTTSIVTGSVAFSTGGNIFNPSGALVMTGTLGTPPTITLPNNITVTNCTFGNSNETVTLTSQTVNITGNLTLGGTGVVQGTSALVIAGTGTWSQSSTGQLRNNLTINTAGTLTVSGTVYYNTGTITYTAGTVTATGSTLNVGLATTVNTSGMTWGTFTAAGATLTITLNSNLYVTNLTIASTGTLTLTPNPVYISGNLTSSSTGISVGPSELIINGTGTWSHSSTGTIRNNLTINTAGTFTISGNVYYNTGTITYTAGTIVNTGSMVWISANTTLNTNSMQWNSIKTWGTITVTLLSALNMNNWYVNRVYSVGLDNLNNYATAANVTISGDFNINISDTLFMGTENFSLLTPPSASTQLNLVNPLVVPNLNIYGSSSRDTYSTSLVAHNVTINNQTLTVKCSVTVNTVGNINSAAVPRLLGTTELIVQGASWVNNIYAASSTPLFYYNSPVTIDSRIRLTGFNFYFGSSTLKCTKNSRIDSTVPLVVISACTLLGMNRALFSVVSITSGITVTMDQFFTGAPNKRIAVQPSSTTNYTITFQDLLEKFARNVSISRATLSRRGQLTVISDKGNQGNNIGVKFAPNQITNGIAKNGPAVIDEGAFGANGLITDPTLS